MDQPLVASKNQKLVKKKLTKPRGLLNLPPLVGIVIIPSNVACKLSTLDGGLIEMFRSCLTLDDDNNNNTSMVMTADFILLSHLR